MASPGHGSAPHVTVEDIRIVVDGIIGLVCKLNASGKELLNSQILSLSQTNLLQLDPNGDHFSAWEQPKLSPRNSELRSENCTS
jgi:hypothetical protein